MNTPKRSIIYSPTKTNSKKTLVNNTPSNIINVCVVSFGGVNCTSLLRILSNYTITNNPFDKDGLKHKPSPKLPVYRAGQIKKVIYVYNNPMNAVLSLFRRGFQVSQYKKLTGQSPPSNFTLKGYINSEQDLFQLENHFDNWSRGSNKFPILLVNGATMYQPENLKKILAYVGVKIPIGLFKSRPRNSDYTEIDSALRHKLEKTYAPLNQKFNQLTDVYLVKKLE